MDYKIVVTEQAEKHLDKIVNYIIEQLKNNAAAISILDDVEETYNRLEKIAGTLQLCNDPYLAEKGYRKIILENHDYLMLYQIGGYHVYVNRIFHMSENYRDKL